MNATTLEADGFQLCDLGHGSSRAKKSGFGRRSASSAAVTKPYRQPGFSPEVRRTRILERLRSQKQNARSAKDLAIEIDGTIYCK